MHESTSPTNQRHAEAPGHNIAMVCLKRSYASWNQAEKAEAMTLPVNVGDKIHDGHWYAPATIVSAIYVEPASEDDFDQAKWLGYMLRPSDAHCAIKYQLPNGGYGWKRFHLELHDGMLLPADMTPSDPDAWHVCRCRIVERASNYQPDLFAHTEYRQLDLFEVMA